MWDELENYRPIPFCSCAISCSCGAIASVKKYREQDYVIRFLKGLNEKFAHSKSQIMMMNPLPDINYAFSLVIQQEREMNSSFSMEVPSVSISEEVAALQVQTHEGNSNAKQCTNNFRAKNQGYNSSRGHNRVCTHYNRTNHTVETCFLKHGFPPGFKGKGKGQVAASVNNASDTSPKDSTSSVFGFTQEQYNNILALLQ